MVESHYRAATGADTAYEGLWAIFRHARQELWDRLGVTSGEEFASLAPSRVRESAGQSLRDLLYYQDQLMVPLRSKTSTLITLDMRPWIKDGEIDAEYPAEIFKIERNGDMSALYDSDGVGEPYDRHLWEMYRRPGGVRECELASRGEQTDAYYIAFGREAHHTQRDENGDPLLTLHNRHLVGAVRRVLRMAHLGGLGFDPALLVSAGVATTHPFRHALATWLCKLGLIEDAALLLHHRGLNMIRAVYSGRQARDAGRAVMRHLTDKAA